LELSVIAESLKKERSTGAIAVKGGLVYVIGQRAANTEMMVH
jgi:hypothetical protein